MQDGIPARRRTLGLAVAWALGGVGCASAPPAKPTAESAPALPPVRVGLALGGGAAKGFAHIGVIKMLEANGIVPAVVAGTSAGSVVGALYASGMGPFELQEKAVALDEAKIRDLQLSSGGLIVGQKLQDYVNTQVGQRALEQLPKPFVAVATRLEDGERTVFAKGNTGQAVRASSSIPGVFHPVRIGGSTYVDGGVVSPVPVDAARELGADVVVAVDISSKARGQTPKDWLGTVNQTLAIMGQKLGQAELSRADVVIRPQVLDMASADFSRRAAAILEGEKATLAALPLIRARIQAAQEQRAKAVRQAQLKERQAAREACLAKLSSLSKLTDKLGASDTCPPAP